MVRETGGTEPGDRAKRQGAWWFPFGFCLCMSGVDERTNMVGTRTSTGLFLRLPHSERIGLTVRNQLPHQRRARPCKDPILIASELLISGRKALVMSEQKHAPEMNQRPNCLGYQLVLSEARLVRRKKRTSMTCLMVRKNERPITLTQGRTRQPLFVPLRIARCCGSAPNSRRRRSWVIRETCWDEGMAGD